MKIDAGRAITDAMAEQKSRDWWRLLHSEWSWSTFKMDLGRQYADRMSQPFELTPEDEDKIADLLDPDAPWKPPS